MLVAFYARVLRNSVLARDKKNANMHSLSPGLVYTGMYFNPILATTVTYGCEGLNTMEHIFVYWIGPIIGQLLGTFTYQSLSAHI